MSLYDPRQSILPYEYPELIGYAKAMHHSFWEIDHFDFGPDMKDFKVSMSDNEREILKRCMLAVNLVEYKVKSFWSVLHTRMPKYEVGCVGSAFGGNEVVHSFCYSELLKKLGLEDAFTNVMEVPCMSGRVKYLNKYLDGVNSRSNKEFTKSLILFTLLVENVSLFSQFLIISSFYKYTNRIKNFSQIVEATSRDECYSSDTEVLTLNGWQYIKDLKVGDSIFQYRDGNIEKTEVRRTISKQYTGDMVQFHKRKSQCLVTPQHDMVYYNPAGDLLKRHAIDFKGDSKKFIPERGTTTSEGKTSLTPLDRLRIAIQADGHMCYWVNAKGEKKLRGIEGGYNCAISVKKDRKIKRLFKLLDDTDISYNVTIDSKGRSKFLFNFPDIELVKTSFDWVDLTSISESWCRDFIEELTLWDGWIRETGGQCYGSTNKKCVDTAQIIGILGGYKANISVREDHRSDNFNTYYKVSFNSGDNYVRSHSLDKNTVAYNGTVHCVTVDSGVIITRLNNDTFIAGNCLHGKFGAHLIRILRGEFPEWFDEEMESKIKRAVAKCFKAECEVLDWIFEGGDLEWMPKNSVKEYLKSRFNVSMELMNYPEVYEIDYDLLKCTEYFDLMVTATTEGDHFNARKIDYSKNISIDENNLF